ncbi:MAG: GerMN domain-containing protein [Bacilli bacterium]|nr:GerMN domain-containing protein [Bacilli bacterium]MCI9586181.1 GerMN domain-containing protein [Bacilli bacterium]
MLKKISIRKIGLTTAALFALTLIYLLPNNKQKLDVNSELEYVDSSVITSPIFLTDKNSYVALTEVAVSANAPLDKARELLNILTIGGTDSKIPSGFNAVIPPDTTINSINLDEGILKIDFSEDLLDVDKEYEEKLIETIVYTLTSIDGISKVIIYVDGDILTKLPKSNIYLPSTLDRSFGINKQYEFTSTDNINDVTVYYINEINDKYYYVPVTKYLNDSRDKITIIIDELTTNFNHNSKLMSFMNEEAKLVSSNIENRKISLDFNSYIFDDATTKDVLEEVIYTICLSAKDNYDIDEVVLTSDNKEFYKTS